MGESRSPGELAAKISAAATGLAVGVERGVRRASLESKGVLVTAAVAPMTGGDMKLSNARGRISVNYRVYGAGDRTRSVFRARGPIMLVEDDTPPHRIEPRRKYARGGRRGGRRAALKINGRYVSGGVRHPGTRGKQKYKKVRDTQVTRLAERVIFESTSREVLRPF